MQLCYLYISIKHKADLQSLVFLLFLYSYRSLLEHDDVTTEQNCV